MFEQDIRLGPGTGTTTSHTLEILIMLFVAGLLGLWLGWVLWSRYKQEAEKLRLDNASLSATADALRTELTTAKSALAAAQAENANLISQMSSLNRNNANLRDRVAELEEGLNITQSRNRVVETELGLSYSPDTPLADNVPLEIIEQHHEANHEDAATDTPAIEPLPATEVAEPATTDDEGFKIKSRIPVGAVTLESSALTTPPAEEPVPVVVVETAEVVLTDSTPPPAKTRSPKTKAAAAAAGAAPADDLTVVEGIGPKIQMLLNQYGIYTYQELADTEVNRLKEILQAAGPQLAMHDPGTWPSQANLAANDQWDALKSIQGFLKGGKRPT